MALALGALAFTPSLRKGGNGCSGRALVLINTFELHQAYGLQLVVKAVVNSASYLQGRQMSSTVPVVGLRVLKPAVQNQRDLIGSAVC